jgi:cytochrome P450
VTLSLTGSKDPSDAGSGATSPAAVPATTTPLDQVRLWDGSTHSLVTRRAEQCALLADARTSADAARPAQPRESASQGGTGAAFRSLVDSGHGRLREVGIPPFAVSWVKMMGPAIQRLVDDQVEGLLSGPHPADLVSAFAEPVSSLVICQLLGVPPQDRAFLHRSSQILIDRGAPPDRAQAALAVLENYLGNLAASKIATPNGDLLSRLAADWVLTGRLTQQELTTVGVMLLITGHETTENVIALGVLSLLQRTGLLPALRQRGEPGLAEAVAEPLRHLSLVHSGTHLLALADIELGSVLIHEGESLILPSEPACGDQAEPAGPGCPGGDIRWAAAFGFGVHQRLGQVLARVELLASYRALARRIPSLSLATSDISFKRDGLVYGVDELAVTW